MFDNHLGRSGPSYRRGCYTHAGYWRIHQEETRCRKHYFWQDRLHMIRSYRISTAGVVNTFSELNWKNWTQVHRRFKKKKRRGRAAMHRNFDHFVNGILIVQLTLFFSLTCKSWVHFSTMSHWKRIVFYNYCYFQSIFMWIWLSFFVSNNRPAQHVKVFFHLCCVNYVFFPKVFFTVCTCTKTLFLQVGPCRIERKVESANCNWTKLHRSANQNGVIPPKKYSSPCFM